MIEEAKPCPRKASPKRFHDPANIFCIGFGRSVGPGILCRAAAKSDY